MIDDRDRRGGFHESPAALGSPPQHVGGESPEKVVFNLERYLGACLAIASIYRAGDRSLERGIPQVRMWSIAGRLAMATSRRGDPAGISTTPPEKAQEAARKVNYIVHEVSVGLDGSISAEHGIGMMHVDELETFAERRSGIDDEDQTGTRFQQHQRIQKNSSQLPSSTAKVTTIVDPIHISKPETQCHEVRRRSNITRARASASFVAKMSPSAFRPLPRCPDVIKPGESVLAEVQRFIETGSGERTASKDLKVLASIQRFHRDILCTG